MDMILSLVLLVENFVKNLLNLIMQKEFEMSILKELNFFLEL